MSKLIHNVIVSEQGWGPAFGNADQVPDHVAAQIGDHAWDAPPSRPDKGQPPDGGAETRTAAVDASPSDDILDGLDIDNLRSLAEEHGVKVDKRWGEDRLRTEIRASDA